MSDEQNKEPEKIKPVTEIIPGLTKQDDVSVNVIQQNNNSILITLPDNTSVEVTLSENNPREVDPSELFLEVIGAKLIHVKWAGRPHQAFKNLPNSSKGDAGEEFLRRYLIALGFNTVKLKRLGDWDLMVNNKKFEVKLASEDVSGSFQFNHIRYDSKYDFLICLGVTPDQLVFGIWNKGDLVTGKAGNLVSMGKNQNSSFKLTKRVRDLVDIRNLKDILKKILQ